MTDAIRKRAEEKLGRPLTDEEWTSQSRFAWKVALHADNYNMSARNLKSLQEQFDAR